MSIEFLVIPLLTQLPSPELYSNPPPSPSTPTTNHTPGNTPHQSNKRTATMLMKRTLDAIVNCRDQLPSLLDREPIVLGTLTDALMKEMHVCKQLTSSDDYLQHKRNKVNILDIGMSFLLKMWGYCMGFVMCSYLVYINAT